MPSQITSLLNAFEIHDAKAIHKILEAGYDPNQLHEGRPLVYSLINMYYRSPKFKDCIRAFVDAGLDMVDQGLLAVLLDDTDRLKSLIGIDPSLVNKTYSLNCTFTPLMGATLLHICAEYNHVACGKVLIDNGANINAKAGIDDYGFGGQTPIFHTVNQHNNNSWKMLKLLLDKGADLSIEVKGLVWGKGYEWETFVPSVNPISYAMMGLLRQFQRTESDIYKVVHALMKQRYDTDYKPLNVPNKYLG